MENPFLFIESKIARRDEFDITEGHHPTHALLYLKEGSFRMTVDGCEEIFRAGDCVILTDDVAFSRSVIDPISFVYIKFRTNPKSSISLPLPTGKLFFQNQTRFLENIRAYEEVMDLVDARSLYYKNHLLSDLLWLWFEEHFPERQGQAERDLTLCHDATVRGAVEYIRANLKKKLTIATLCAVLGTNPTTLNFKFRRELSTSVGAFVTAERIRLAKQLLSSTSFSVGEIAARCGYDNIYYFSTAFHKELGQSPSDFRKSCR